MGAFLFFLVLLGTQIVGGEQTYTVQRGDSLTSVGARFGVDVWVLAERNGLEPSGRLAIGQNLQVDNRHIVPAPRGVNFVINVPQRMLFFFDRDGLSCACPIAAGAAGWRTPLGEFEVTAREEKPTWDVPPSIQEEMRRNGKAVVTRVPPSPQNPLGEYWIALSMPGIGIHGTNLPSSVYKLVTHGCIRLHPDDIRSLFNKVTVGMRGRVVYEPVLVAQRGDSVFVEIHPDPEKKEADPFSKVRDIARSEGLLSLVDETLLREAVRRRDGIATEVTRR